jgi:DNA-binding IclR family transcriptional regulator
MTENLTKTTKRMDKDYSKVNLWPNGTQNVRRTIAILRALGEHNENGANLSQIAKFVNLPLPTVKRILAVMVMEGFAQKNETSKQYTIGSQLYDLSKKGSQSRLRDTCHPLLETLAKETEDTTQLIVRSGFDAICLDLVEGNRSVRIKYGIGSRLPLGLGISGVVILAFLPEREIEEVLSINSRRYHHYKVKINDLRRQIKNVQIKGCNIRSESMIIEGIAGVGVPILSPKKEIIGSITVSSTTARMTIARCKYIAKLIQNGIYAITRSLMKDVIANNGGIA